MKSLDYEFDFRDERNLNLIMDLYELTMSQCYFSSDHKDHVVTFDLFYRRNPDSGGYAVFAGLKETIGYIQNLHFEDSDIACLHSLNCLDDEFLGYLWHFILISDTFAVREGTPMFPYEPLIHVKAKIIEARLLETTMLLCVNHQTLIIVKAKRIVKVAQGRTIVESGVCRVHNFDVVNYSTRAAFISGVAGTATTYAGRELGMPVLGTIVHSPVQSPDCKYGTFLIYARAYPDSCTVLLDTYNTLKSGLANATRMVEEYLEPNGYRLQSMCIDSGGMTYLLKKVRTVLDAVGMEDRSIVISNSLDEYLIQSLTSQEAQINSMGVGENLVCSRSAPILGGVCEMSPILDGDTTIPKIRVSEDVGKVVNPDYKDLYRTYDKESGKAAGDLMTIHKESLDLNRNLTAHHQMNSWKNKTTLGGSYVLRDLLDPIFLSGELVYEVSDLQEIRTYSEQEFSCMWDKTLCSEYPQTYYVDPSKQLLGLKLKVLGDVKHAG